MTDCCAHEGPDRGDARFDVTKVADGVYAAVAAPAYKVNCNTAIIENDDGVMIVDTHSKPSAARVIIERLRDITRKPVRGANRLAAASICSRRPRQLASRASNRDASWAIDGSGSWSSGAIRSSAARQLPSSASSRARSSAIKLARETSRPA